MITITRKLLKEGGIEAVNARRVDGNTALHLAAKNENLTLVKILLQHGANVHATNLAGETPLLSQINNTIDKTNIFICKKLIKYGADVNAVNTKGFSVLHIISIFGCENSLVLNLFLEAGADIFQKDERGYSSVLLAAYWGRENILKKYLSFLKGFRIPEEGLEEKITEVLSYRYEGKKTRPMLESFLTELKIQKEKITEAIADIKAVPQLTGADADNAAGAGAAAGTATDVSDEEKGELVKLHKEVLIKIQDFYTRLNSINQEALGKNKHTLKRCMALMKVKSEELEVIRLELEKPGFSFGETGLRIKTDLEICLKNATESYQKVIKNPEIKDLVNPDEPHADAPGAAAPDLPSAGREEGVERDSRDKTLVMSGRA
jgi:ankyrin repeat protein